MRREGQSFMAILWSLYSSINFDELLSLFVKILHNYFFLFRKIVIKIDLYVNKTDCVQDEEFLIIEENGK